MHSRIWPGHDLILSLEPSWALPAQHGMGCDAVVLFTSKIMIM